MHNFLAYYFPRCVYPSGNVYPNDAFYIRRKVRGFLVQNNHTPCFSLIVPALGEFGSQCNILIPQAFQVVSILGGKSFAS